MHDKGIWHHGNTMNLLYVSSEMRCAPNKIATEIEQVAFNITNSEALQQQQKQHVSELRTNEWDAWEPRAKFPGSSN